MRPRYALSDRTHLVEPARLTAGELTLAIDGSPVIVSLNHREGHRAVLRVDGVEREVWTAVDGQRLFIHLDGRAWEIEAIDTLRSGDDAEVDAGLGQVRAPMPGTVLEVKVAEGDHVAAGTHLALIESMKLQTEIVAPLDGTVREICYSVGSSFDKGSILIEIESDSSEDGDGAAEESGA